MKERQLLAAQLTELHTCDTLLDVARAKLVNRDLFITEQQDEIDNLNLQIGLNDRLLVLKEEEIKQVNLKLVKEVRRHKFTKILWGTTSIALGATIVYFIIN